MAVYWIGLMSGTSMDAADAVLVSFTDQSLTIAERHSLSYPEQLRHRLLLATRNQAHADELGELDTLVGQHFARTAHELIDKAGVPAEAIRAIGSHGQTIRHQPTGSAPFSLQIGNASWIAEITGISTVSDFRSRDIAAGGQGAPLVPAFHQWLFSSGLEDRCILNLGGIANVTWLPADLREPATGFDTGPANALMDAWCMDQTGRHFDENGHMAAEGEVIPDLLSTMLSDAYFGKRPPKSTGTERFNLGWVHTQLQRFNALSPEDIQRTLLQLTASTVLNQLPQSVGPMAVYACGGGTQNPLLMNELQKGLGPVNLRTTNELGLDPLWVEPTAFAWLAKEAIESRPGNLPTVTGARGSRILGAIYPG